MIYINPKHVTTLHNSGFSPFDPSQACSKPPTSNAYAASELCSHVDFRLDGGELLDLQGGNGSGKNQSAAQICGLSAPANGEIRWRGELIGKLGEDYRRELCFLGHHNAIKEELTPLENLLASAKLADEILDAGEALDALEIVGLATRRSGLSLPVAGPEAPCRAGTAGQ